MTVLKEVVMRTTVIFIFIGLSGCLQRRFNDRSELKESLGRFNSPESLGLSANALDWASIQNETKGERAKAWSDTWWPHYSKGLADRYLLRKSSTESENLKGRGALFSRFVQQYLKTIAKKDPKELALLSPAEKYDYLMSQKTMSNSLLEKLEQQTQMFSSSKAEISLLSLEDKLEKLGEYDDSYKTLNQEYTREANAASPTFKPLLADGAALSDEVKKYLPLTSHDWNLWLETFSWAHDDEWAWMGICNGWSPAALREQLICACRT